MTPAELRELIAAKGMTQAQAGEVMYRTPRCVHAWVAGRRRIDPAAVALLRLAAPLGAQKPRRGPRNRVKADA